MAKGIKPVIKYLIVFIIAALLIFLVLFFVKKRNTPQELTLFHNLPNSLASSVESQIKHYDTISPGVNITITQGDAEDLQPEGFDFYILGGNTLTDQQDTEVSRYFWTGKSWFLGINRKAAGSILVPESFESLQALEDFFESLKAAGITPLAIGNSHGWPMALWSQHIEQSLGISSLQGDDPESWVILKGWNDKGYMDRDLFQEGWSRGISEVSDAVDAVVLMNSSMVSSIPAEERGNFLFMNFPQGKDSQPWLIGSGYLIVFDSEESSSLSLAEYLLSPAVCEILTKETGSLFQSNQPENLLFIPGRDSIANTPDGRSYNQNLKNFVEGKR